MWTTPPARSDTSGDTLTVFTAPSTDFWRVTHYGFIRDNGHFLPQTVSRRFSWPRWKCAARTVTSTIRRA